MKYLCRMSHTEQNESNWNLPSLTIDFDLSKVVVSNDDGWSTDCCERLVLSIESNLKKPKFFFLLNLTLFPPYCSFEIEKNKLKRYILNININKHTEEEKHTMQELIHYVTIIC